MNINTIHNADYNNSIISDIGIIISVLESGNSVELPATGFSMFPTLRPGDRVIVKSSTKGELPEPGSVVVYIDKGFTAQRYNGITVKRQRASGVGQETKCTGETIERQNYGLVMHRLLEIIYDDSHEPLLITRGDSRPENDNPWPGKQLLGVAVSYKRGEKEYPVKTFIPGFLRYKFNARLLWFYGKLGSVKKIVSAGQKPLCVKCFFRGSFGSNV